jgi:2-keto-4-pentenoate hydratase/2-oxohepta-3-ene-1,7-dioic acid hydratase in catechol pathway
MKIVRYWDSASDKPFYGVVEGDSVVQIEGNPYGEIKLTKSVRPLSGLRLLPPCEPTKIVCGGLNYKGHALETNQPIPDVSVCFLKPPSSLIGHEEPIIYPRETERLEFELELAVVIKKTMHYTPPEDVYDHILGYTCGNDVTARDITRAAKHNLVVSKAFDTFCPVGPWIETDLDPGAIDMVLKVNGQVRQKENTRDMIFPVPIMLSYFSHIMTLHPGDLILTGTPAGIGRMEIGETCEITIEGIGTLRNPIVASPLRR